MLESIRLTKRFGSMTALEDVSLALEAGHVYAMLGPNGSGKTTWMKLAAGLYRPSAGQMLYRGRPVGVDSRRHVAYMSTEPYFYRWMTARDVGVYNRRFFRDFSPEKYAELLDRFELGPRLKVVELSSGMMAKLKVAVTLARNADAILLDEPFNGIDLLARDDIADAILGQMGRDRLIVLSSHLVSELTGLCDRAVYMWNGRLGAVADMMDTRRDMEDVYREIYRAWRAEP